jgi:dihydroorotate dehydrogenase
MDPERAHGLTIRLLGMLPGRGSLPPRPRLALRVFGLDFPNPLGLAAGFDKNAEVPDAMLGLGFGFVEVGTLTPLPQSGNPRPRLFRLPEDRAVINRMGFNNCGSAEAAARLASRGRRSGIVGVNIGANRNSPDRIDDYVRGISAFAGIASYVTVNISSPNTPGLRALQSRDELERLLDRLNAERAYAAIRLPMLLKIAPDLGMEDLRDIAACCADGAVDGIIVSNTAVARPALASRHRGETGGLSGRPIFDLSTRVLAQMHLLTGGRIPLVGAGGIEDAETAFRKIRAGATLLQLYTALVYEGPAVVGRILDGLESRLAGRRLAGEAGRDAEAIAHQGLSGM